LKVRAAPPLIRSVLRHLESYCTAQLLIQEAQKACNEIHQNLLSSLVTLRVHMQENSEAGWEVELPHTITNALYMGVDGDDWIHGDQYKELIDHLTKIHYLCVERLEPTDED